MISAEQLMDAFVKVTDTLVVDFDLIDFLHELTDHSAAVSGAEAAGLSLADQQGQLRFMAATNETGRSLELFQLQNAEGPCVDCYATKNPVINADLESATERWPRFAPVALAAGFHSVHAFPLQLRDEVIGVLNLFGHADQAFEESDVRMVQALANAATIGLLQERAISRSDVVTEQLQGALNSRIVIDQAKGVLAQHEGMSPTEAFELMRTVAQVKKQRLVDVAIGVIDQTSQGR